MKGLSPAFGAEAVMLSGEAASGDFPCEAATWFAYLRLLPPSVAF